jgi:pilus assembly protein CpaC
MRLARWLGITLACAALGGVSESVAAQSQGGQGRNTRAEESDDIGMAVGETRTIPARDVKNYSEGVPGIIDVKLTTDASQFIIVGKKPGSTTLLLIKADGSQRSISVNVFSRSPAVVENELGQLLQGLNVQTRRIGSQIVIDGAVSSEADLQRVQQVVGLYPNQVLSLVQLSQPGAPAAARRLAPVQKFLVRIDFYFVQYDKNSSYGVGIGWPGSIGAGASLEVSHDLLAQSTRSATASISQQALPRLDIASSHGWAKVLKQATVITNNDNEASFANGGEQNFPVNTGLTIGVERIGFGIDLKVRPHYDPQSRELGLKLDADISDLTSAVAGTSLPGRATSKLSTSVSLKLGQSLILSGIHTESLTHSVSGLPGLSEIPVLGILFGSHSQSRLETEGAIFVVPSVVQSVPSAASELVDLALGKFKEYDGDVKAVGAFDKRPGGGVNVPR